MNLEDYKTILVEGKIEEGKTTGVIFNEVDKLIKKNENLLFLDVKKEYINNYYQILKDNDYNIITLNLDDFINSNNYNPYYLPYQYYKKGEIDKSIDLIENVNKYIFKDENSDPFWKESATSLFTGLALTIIDSCDEKEFNIASVNACVDLAIKKYNDSNLIKMYLDKLEPTDPIYTLTSGSMYAPYETKSSIISVIKSKTNDYCNRPLLLSLLSNNNIDFNLKNKTAIFIILHDNSSRFNDIANMFIEQLYFLVKNNNIPFNFILDNIDFISTLNCLNSMLNLPLPNVKTIVATRDLECLKNLYPLTTFANVLAKVKVNDNKVIINNQEYQKEKHPIKNDNPVYPKLNLETKYFNVKEYFEKDVTK